MLPSLSLPPLEFCLGTSPIQAEKSRPERNALGSPMLATRAVANARPTPGIASADGAHRRRFCLDGWLWPEVPFPATASLSGLRAPVPTIGNAEQTAFSDYLGFI